MIIFTEPNFSVCLNKGGEAFIMSWREIKMSLSLSKAEEMHENFTKWQQ